MGKNNSTIKQRQSIDAQRRYALRKLSIGTVSVIIGLTFLGTQVSAQAATTENQTNNEQLSTGNVETSSGTSMMTTPAPATTPETQPTPAESTAMDQAPALPAEKMTAEKPAMTPATPAQPANWLATPALDRLANEQPQLKEQLEKLTQAGTSKASQDLKNQLKLELADRLKGVPREDEYLAAFERETDPAKLMDRFTELSDKQVLHRRDITNRKVTALRAAGKEALKGALITDIRRLADETVEKVELTRASERASSLTSQLKAAQFKLAGYQSLPEASKKKLQDELVQLRTQVAQYEEQIASLLDAKGPKNSQVKADQLIKDVRETGQKVQPLVSRVDEENGADVKVAQERALAELLKLTNLMKAQAAVKEPVLKALEEEIKAPTVTGARIGFLMDLARMLQLPEAAPKGAEKLPQAQAEKKPAPQAERPVAPAMPKQETLMTDPAAAEAWLKTPFLDQLATTYPQLRGQLQSLKQTEYDSVLQELKKKFGPELQERLQNVPRTENLRANFDQTSDLTKLRELFTELSDKRDAHRRDVTERKVKAIQAKAKAQIEKANPQDIRRLADEASQQVELTRVMSQVEGMTNQLMAANFQLAGYNFLSQGEKEKLQSSLNQWRGRVAKYGQEAKQLLTKQAVDEAAGKLVQEVGNANDQVRDLVEKVDDAREANLKAALAAALGDLPKLKNLAETNSPFKVPTLAALEAELKTPTNSVDRLVVLMGMAEKLDLPQGEGQPEAMPEQPRVNQPAAPGEKPLMPSPEKPRELRPMMPEAPRSPMMPEAPKTTPQATDQPAPMAPNPAAPEKMKPAPMMPKDAPAVPEKMPEAPATPEEGTMAPTETPQMTEERDAPWMAEMGTMVGKVPAPAMTMMGMQSGQTTASVMMDQISPAMVKDVMMNRSAEGMDHMHQRMARLPQTGSHQGSTLSLLGTGILAFAGLLGLKLRRRDE